MIMTAQEIILILESGITIALLIVVLLKLWAGFRLDEFRQSVFVVRDELFDFALAGKIAFDHPAYKLLRQSMNGFIRYAHQLTWFRLVCNVTRWQLLGEGKVFTWADQWEAALGTIENENVKRALLEFQARTLGLVAKRLVTGSAILMLLVGGMVLLEMLRTHWISLRQLVRNAATGTINRFVDPRFLEEEASRA